MQAVTPVPQELDQAWEELLRFADNRPRLTYEELDALTLTELRLFGVPKDAYFARIEEALDRIIRALPAMKRIFAKPIVRLKDVSEIVPAEMARIINSHTLAHASNHSALWDDINEDGIKPKKLMTVGRTETYAIYENIIFAHVVDAVLRFLRRTEDLLKDVLYNCRDMQFNLLDRTHHQSFFLALGKLYAGYSSAQDHQYASYFRCIDKISLIDRVLRARLHLPVYAQCKKKGGKLTLKKTSVFRVHKDYRDVYRLAQWIENEIDLKELSPSGSERFSRKGYRAYCVLLSIFAAGHFNFQFPKDTPMDLVDFEAACDFRDWSLTVRSACVASTELLILKTQKDLPYTVCLMLAEKKSLSATALAQIREGVCADEYLFANAEEYGEDGVVYLSLFNIDSFRRLQQILLRGMILSDQKREVCPFCGKPLERQGSLLLCGACRAEIKEEICPVTEKPYVTSGIQKYGRPERDTKRASAHEKFLHDRYLEASLHFRNITPIAPNGNFICPQCGKVHE
ncbi:MAG: hypothetical protein E7629_02640 [Ruminococcaceae bacterium]|nr:hypothetical protein [Oscillospiraceae bacterium]